MNFKALVLAHLNTLIFSAGFVTVIASVAQWSGRTAGVLAGGVLMLIAAWPYLRRPVRKS